MKTCAKCLQIRPLKDFYNKDRSYCIWCNRQNCREYGANNKEKRNKRLKRWRRNNPEKARLMDKKKAYKSKYGLTLQQVDKLVGVSGGGCWICDRKDKRLVVDHNHKTGKVRGMLCDLCNKHLGYFENMDFKKIKQYLDKPCHADILLEIANE